MPIVRPPSLLRGTIASAASCHAPLTYAKPGFIVAAVFLASRRIECELDEGNELIHRLILGKLARGIAAREIECAVLNRESPVQRIDVTREHRAEFARLLVNARVY